jgi:hypothetical protein
MRRVASLTPLALATIAALVDSGAPRFHRVKAPDRAELEVLVRRVSERVGRCLERLGLLVRDADDCRDAGARAKQELEPKAPG